MKKSKIILPAVALLTVSTVAAASSTVAWFTAGRSVTVSGTTVAVYNPESSLKVELGANADAGTELTNNATEVKLPTHMRDGSVNAFTGKIYKRDIVDETKYYEAKYTEDIAITANGEKDIYRATSWTMTFKMDAAATDSYAILLNSSSFTSTTVANTAGTAYKAFRIAFVADGNVAIFAPFADGNTPCKYVESLTDTTATTGEYDTESIISSSAAKQESQIEATAAASLKGVDGLIGTIPAKNGNADEGLVVTCYAWFEGEDPNCVVSEAGVAGDITTVLEFYAVRVVANAAA